MHHKLKILPQYFNPIIEGRKTFEIRENDRGYQAGDTVELCEWDDINLYSGRAYKAKIGYVSALNQKDNWVVFSLILSDA
jgi:ASC-1-like (ASCH) protein